MLLKELSEAVAVSSREDEVRTLLKEHLSSSVDEVKTDRLGNLFCYKGWKESQPKILIAAHMDEVGLMVTKIEKDGFLRFQPVGSLDPRVLVSKPVVIGKEKVPGVIGAKPIHLQEPDERKKALDFKDLFIDIGVDSKAEAEGLVSLGDLVAFSTEYEELGDGIVKGKAFDDRAGCAVLAEILKRDYRLGLAGVFTVQEEVGARGAEVVGKTLEPDLTIVLEGTTAADVPEIEEHEGSTKMGYGPALTIMDGSVLPHRPTLDKLLKIAEANDIPIQFRRSTKGFTDAGSLQRGRGGIPTVVVSVPCRYIHSPACLVDTKDIENTVALIVEFLRSVEQEGVPS
ncbi:MAG: M42 family metallopeptidase [Firmicutes bacterium]|nr:M42 family metallopeptidase [Bacillota bacterium]